MLGFGVDQGWLDLDVPDAMETAQIDLTQFALGARFGSGPFSLAMSASYGFGSVDSTSSLIAVSTASYDVDVIGLFAEASYTFEAGGWRLVPKAAIDHVRIDSEAFTGSGMLGLSVPSHDSDRTRLVPGLEFGRSFRAWRQGRRARSLRLGPLRRGHRRRGTNPPGRLHDRAGDAARHARPVRTRQRAGRGTGAAAAVADVRSLPGV